MSRKPDTFSFARVITKKKEDLARVRADISELAEQADAFAPAFAIANALAKHATALGFCKNMRVEPSTYTSWAGAENANYLRISMQDTVQSLKDGAVPALIEKAIALGFEATESRDYATSCYASRLYRFTLRVNGVEITLTLEADIEDGSEACKRVQTGTKLEEVAQYEIVCQ